MFEGTHSVFNITQTLLTNHSKLRIYLCKIPTVITAYSLKAGCLLKAWSMVGSYRGSTCSWMWATLKWSTHCWVKHG